MSDETEVGEVRIESHKGREHGDAGDHEECHAH